MMKDLRAIETLWKTLQSERYKTQQAMVLGIQEEMFGGYFFFGKMDIVEIEPLKPSEMIDAYAYRQKWETFAFITEEALCYRSVKQRSIQAFPEIPLALYRRSDYIRVTISDNNRHG
jgi:hypothetical protein